jgi:hypothetical protein
MKKTVTKAFVSVCGITGCAAFAFGISFYFRGLPHLPQPELGRIYPLNNHGHLLFMTRSEQLQQEVAFVISASLFVVAALIQHFLDPFENNGRNASRSSQPWNHRWGP